MLQIPAMFVLTLVGWLLFRETELSAIVRDLQLSPFDSTPFERQAGLYLFLLAFGYSIPLWVQSVWVELHRGQPRAGVGWGVAALRALACGAAFAAILVLRSRRRWISFTFSSKLPVASCQLPVRPVASLTRQLHPSYQLPA